MNDQKPTKHTGPPIDSEQSPRITLAKEKDLERIEKDKTRLQTKFKEFDRAVQPKDLADGEQAIAFVKALSETPSQPTVDEVRLYVRKNGRLFKFTGSEV